MNPGGQPLLGSRVCHYRITEWLGAGGMGVVYKALDEKLGRPVALKFLPPEASGPSEKRSFVQEARAASALDHPNIGVIHGLEETPEGRLFMVMAYYDGETLVERLRRGPLAEDQVVDIGHQIALGLAEAHSKGLVHRDIKPGNIMISRQNLVKLLDFGLAKLTHMDTMTRSGVTSGTPAYMSPEQAMGVPVDHRSDIWSLGVVLFEMLSGQRPFVRANIPSTMLAIVQDSPASLDLPQTALQAVVYKCLAKDPEQRYQSAGQVADDLARLRSTVDGAAPTLTIRAGELARIRSRASVQAVGLRASALRSTGPRMRWAVWTTSAVLLAGGAWYGVTKRSGPVMPREKHVAVLPFTNIGGDRAVAAICDGMLETLTSRLSSLEQGKEPLWVAPSSEVRRRNVADADAARRIFGANIVVTGAVQKHANGVRLTVNLIDTQTLRQLGSKVIDDRFGNFAGLEDNAVTELARMLAVESGSVSLPRASGESATPAAYESYLKGLSYLQRYDKPGNLDMAIQLFDAAARSDPRFALAFSRMGEAEQIKYRLSHERPILDRALADARHGAQLNDQLAPVHVTLGQVHAEGGNYDLAVQEFQKALALDPRDAEAYQHLATTYESQGRLAEAEASIKKAIALRPDYWSGYNTLGTLYYRHEKFSEAAAQYRKVIELTPDNANAYINLGVMLKNLNDLPGARQAYERSIAIAPSYAAYSNLAVILYNEADYVHAAEVYEKALHMNDHDYRPWSGLATSYLAAGLPDKARPALLRAAALAEDEAAGKPTDAGLLSYLASYYAKLGAREKALSRMETALVLAPGDQRVLYMAALTHEVLGDRAAALKWLKAALAKGYPAASVLQDPDLRKLREDSGFVSLKLK